LLNIAAVKQYKDKVPGLNVVAEEMAEFFKKSGKKQRHPSKKLPPPNQTNIGKLWSVRKTLLFFGFSLRLCG